MNKNSTLSGNRITSISISSRFILVLLSAITLLTVLSTAIAQHSDHHYSKANFQSTVAGNALTAMDNIILQVNGHSIKQDIDQLKAGAIIIKLLIDEGKALPKEI